MDDGDDERVGDDGGGVGGGDGYGSEVDGLDDDAGDTRCIRKKVD